MLKRKMDFMRSCVFFLLLLHLKVTESFFLDASTFSFLSEETNNLRTAEWFRWGQLYSYCTHLQVHEDFNSSSVDYNCYASSCKQCVTVYNFSLPFNLTSCQQMCNNSTSCKSGCLFYSNITSNTQENFMVDEQNKPDFNSTWEVLAIDRQYYNVTFEWPIILSKDASIHSIYLISITVKNDPYFPGTESVLGFVGENTFMLEEKVVCNNIYPISGYDAGTLFQLNVYPVNFNGYNQSSKLSSNFTTFTNPGGLNNFSLNDIKYTRAGIIQLEWVAKWTYPKDFENFYNTIEIIFQYKYCSTLSYSTLFSLGLVNVNRYISSLKDMQTNISLFNTDDDDLNECVIEAVVVPRIGQCSTGAILTFTYNYTGCKSVPDYDPNYCHPATTPKPTDLPISNKKYNISEMYYLGKIDNCNTSISCGNYTYQPFFNITVFWDKPATSYPIINYRIAYGTLQDLKTNVILKIPFNDVTIPPDSLSYCITGVIPGTYFGFYIHATTETPDNPFRPLHSDEYLKIQVPPAVALSSPTTDSSTQDPEFSNESSTQDPGFSTESSTQDPGFSTETPFSTANETQNTKSSTSAPSTSVESTQDAGLFTKLPPTKNETQDVGTSSSPLPTTVRSLTNPATSMSQPTTTMNFNKRYNISQIYSKKLASCNNNNISCNNYSLLSFYNITVFWDKPIISSPITGYKLAYGALQEFKTSIVLSTPYTIQTVSLDTLSYCITEVTPGIYFGFYIHAITGTMDSSFRPLNSNEYLKIQVPPAATSPSSTANETQNIKSSTSGFTLVSIAPSSTKNETQNDKSSMSGSGRTYAIITLVPVIITLLQSLFN